MVRLRQKAAATRGILAALAAGAVGVALLGEAPAATPVFTAASNAATAASSQTLTIPRPAGVGEAHVLVAAVAVRLGSATAVSAPGGWIDIVRTTCSGDGADLTQAIFVRAASAAEPAEYTFSVTAATGAVGSVLAYTGVDRVQPVDASGGRISRNTRGIIGPSITTTAPSALLVGAFAHSGRSAISTPTGMTARGDSTTGVSAPNARMLAADQLLAGVGPTGDRGALADARNACSVGQLVALRAAPDPPSSTSLPVLSGVAQEGAVLSATTASWSGSPTGFAYRWQRSSDGGQTWLDIAGATSAAYPVSAADVGFTIRAVVTASNSGGSGSAASAPSAAVLPAPPASLSPPTISGTTREHETLTADAGSWSGSPTGYAFGWERCGGGGCAAIPGADGGTHLLTAADVGFTVRVVVTASNAGGSGSAASSATTPVEPASPPGNVEPPAISGVAQEGETLTASTGTWSDSPTAYAFQWEHCDQDGGSCNPISGARDGTYEVTGADVGFTMRVLVTASNAAGRTEASSPATGVVLPAAPVSSSPPTVSGEPVEGGTLVALTGEWTGAPTSYVIQWERCDTAGGACSPVPDATASTHSLGAADVGFTIRVAVTAANAGGSRSAASQPTAVVLPAPPVNVSPPTISGPVRASEVLRADAGAWSGPVTGYAYAWQRSSDGGPTWLDIAGADGADYVPTDADIGFTVRVVVTASNPGGSASAASTATVVVTPAVAPTAIDQPAILGTAQEGLTVTATTGAWTGSPTGFGYQWERCQDTACTVIRWANVADYTLKDDDVGLTVRVVVTASNAGGPSSATSEPTGVVLPLSPVNEELPTIAGVPEEGEQLTALPGTWQSAGPASFAYSWQRSSDGGQTWGDIAGADEATHAITGADVGSALRVVVTASNAGGSAAASSDPTAAVTPPGGPIAVVSPSIWGFVQTGRILTATTGTWSGSPTGYTYRWQRSSDDGSTWIDIPGAAAFRYTLTAADVGLAVRALVTGSNGIGSNTAATNSATVYPAGNLIVLVNRTWYCDFPVDLDFVRVTITDSFNRDAVRFDECTGRIGRVEIDTNGADGLKVRNNVPVAQDLVIEEGYVRCSGYPEGVHQDAIQALGGLRVTFRNLLLACQGNGNLFIARGGSGASTPTDIVCENCVLGPTGANPALISTSTRSGMRNTLACQSPVWGHSVEYRPDAAQAVGVSSVPVVIFTPSDPDVALLTDGNEVALASDPRCYQEPGPPAP